MINKINNYDDYTKLCYKNQLKKDLNRLGILLIIYFGAMITISLAINLILLAVLGYGDLFTSFITDTKSLYTQSGMISLVIFFLIGLIYCLIRRQSFANLFPFKKIKAGYLVTLCCVGLAVCMVANYMSNIIMELFSSAGVDAYVDMDYECTSAVDILVNYLTVAVIPAFVEEFSFRGIILGSLRKYSDGFAVLVSAILFGVMHGNFMQMPFAFVVGLVLGIVCVKTNSLLPSMIIHFANNAISVSFSVLSDVTNISNNAVNIIYIALLLVISVVGIIATVKLQKKHKDFFELKSNDDTDEILTFKEKVKQLCKTPTMIIFVVLCLLESVYMLSL